MKSQVPIDQLLVWAFRDGAPPDFGSRSRGMFDARFFELGTVIDAMQFSGPSYIDDRHPDAVRVQEAVFGLCKVGEVRLSLKNECTFFLGQLALYVRDEDLGPEPSVNPGALVLQYAILGGYPRWNFGQPKLLPYRGPNGHAKLIGRLIREKCYTAGSVNPLRLEPSPLEIARARHEYATWWEAIRDLPQQLSSLEDHIAMPPNAPFAPWIIKQPGVKHSTHSIIDGYQQSSRRQSKIVLCTPEA